MSKLESLINLEYEKKRYTIVMINYAGMEVPVLLDRIIYKVLRYLKFTWYINDKGYIYKKNGDREDEHILLHDLVMKLGRVGILKKDRLEPRDIIRYLKHALYSDKGKYPIIHINCINYDNRYANLEFDMPNKEGYVRNTKKKKRTINLKKYGISVQELPTYVWYLKEDGTHGDRFCIEIPDEISWRSTSSKKLSLLYKLEETKKYLRYLKRERPDIFDYFCMNGDLSLQGKTLLKEYNKMIKMSGYVVPVKECLTDKFIKKDLTKLTPAEIYVLSRFDPIEEDTNAIESLREWEQLKVKFIDHL